MRITLIHEHDTNERLSLEEFEWITLLNTAGHFEWDAPGTEEPDDWEGRTNEATWGGDYVPAQSQKVSEGDADSLANALEQASEEVRLSNQLSEYEKESGQAHLREVISFLQGGVQGTD